MVVDWHYFTGSPAAAGELEACEATSSFRVSDTDSLLTFATF